MKLITLLITVLTLQGCSTMTKSKTYGAITGSLICGSLGLYLGKELSPDAESDSFNKTIGLVSGLSLCGISGYYMGKSFFESDPRNMEYEPLDIKDRHSNPRPNQETLNRNIEDLDLSALTFEKSAVAQIPLIKSLPNELKRKVVKQRIIKYIIKPQVIKYKDGRILYFSGGEAIEHRYQK